MIKNLFWTKASLFLLFIFSVNAIALAQNNPVKENIELRPPLRERFVKDEQLVMPWRRIFCLIDDKEVNPPHCPKNSTENTRNIGTSLTIYNSDGTIWDNFSINSFDSSQFWKNKNVGFLPFSTQYNGEIIYLRMVSESPNWYEVEVNEATQATKFILKSDPFWAKVTWNYFLATVKVLSFDEDNQTQLFDKPNGSPIEESSEVKLKGFGFRLKTEGEWAFVEGYGASKTYQGWVRWRKGREMLFESKFFNHKFNKPTVKE
jgi:hypothetical protein